MEKGELASYANTAISVSLVLVLIWASLIAIQNNSQDQISPAPSLSKQGYSTCFSVKDPSLPAITLQPGILPTEDQKNKGYTCFVKEAAPTDSVQKPQVSTTPVIPQRTLSKDTIQSEEILAVQKSSGVTLKEIVISRSIIPATGIKRYISDTLIKANILYDRTYFERIELIKGYQGVTEYAVLTRGLTGQRSSELSQKVSFKNLVLPNGHVNFAEAKKILDSFEFSESDYNYGFFYYHLQYHKISPEEFGLPSPSDLKLFADYSTGQKVDLQTMAAALDRVKDIRLKGKIVIPQDLTKSKIISIARNPYDNSLINYNLPEVNLQKFTRGQIFVSYEIYSFKLSDGVLVEVIRAVNGEDISPLVPGYYFNKERITDQMVHKVLDAIIATSKVVESPRIELQARTP